MSSARLALEGSGQRQLKMSGFDPRVPKGVTADLSGQLSSLPEALLHLSEKLETLRCGSSHTSR